MVFSSMTFLSIFLPAFFFFYFLSISRNYRNIILFIFSLLFYAWGEPIYIVLMLFSIGFNYIGGFIIVKLKDSLIKSRIAFILIITVNISVLYIFKYFNFFVKTINITLGIDIPLPNIPLPIGISFYTFQILSYIIDLRNERVPLQRSFIKLGTYITMFPQLIAGPIVRYDTINKALDSRRENLSDFTEGIRLFILGLAKKILIANTMAQVADTLLNNREITLRFVESWYAIIAYTFQIYFDFSGYSTMAIGLGLMLGFNFPNNFNYPYISLSVTEFWRRWHITLSSFFRDYLYIPLGGNRVTKTRWLINILIVWFLTGLWHGSSWNFVLWGLYFGAILVIEKLFFLKLIKKIPLIFCWLYTFFAVVFGWVLFRMETLDDIKDIISSMVGLNGFCSKTLLFENNLIQYLPWVIIAGIFSFPLYNKLQKLREHLPLNLLYDIVLYCLFILCISFLLTKSFNPFIYFRF